MSQGIRESLDRLAARELNATLPAVSGTDNGKILKVVDGVWDKAAMPTELPAVSGTDNGKVLTVSSGEWAAAAPATELPAVTSGDAGKVLMVNESGQWVAGSLT